MDEIIEVIPEDIEEEIFLEEESYLNVKSEHITVELDLANGDQVVSPTGDALFSKVTITKPEDLESENIVEGHTIANVPGSAHLTVTEEKTVAADFSGGDIIVTPDTGYDAMTSVTVEKDVHQIAANIRAGATIAGTPGTFSADATATESDVIAGKTFGAGGEMKTGELIVSNKFHDYCAKTLIEVTAEDLAGVTNISHRMFANQRLLEHIELPNTVTSMQFSAIMDTNKLFTLKLPDSVITLPGDDNYSYLKKLKIGSGLSTIGLTLMGDGYNDLIIVCTATTPPTASKSNFLTSYRGKKVTVYVLPECLDLYKSATNWSNYADKIFAATEEILEEAETW